MRLCLIALVLLLAATRPGLAAADAPAASPEPAAEAPLSTLDEVVVVGSQPGPGLWRVSKGEHVLWVLGTLSPLPRRMQWHSREVEQTLAEAQELLLAPGVGVKADVGLLRGLFLLPAALGARKNPEKERLADVLPAELYQRWQPLKRQYLGRGNGIEKQRPLLAANKLYEKAIRRSGLTLDNLVLPVVVKTAKRHDLRVTNPQVEVEIADPRQVIRELAQSRLEDVECFRQTLDRVETDLGSMQARANAWATGDLDALRALPFTDQRQACADAVLQASVAQNRGLSDLRERMQQAWLAAAETALARNSTSFAMLPMGELLKPDGYLAILAQRGYEVEAP